MWHQVVKNQFFEYLAYDSKKGYDIYDFIFGLVAVTMRNTSFSLSVNCHEADKRLLLMPIPTLVIGSLTAWLKTFACFRGSAKRGLSGSENKHFNAKCSLYGFFAKNIVTFTPHMAHLQWYLSSTFYTRASLNFTYSMLDRFLKHFSPLHPAARNGCSQVKAKTITCEKLSRAAFSCHSEKEDKVRNHHINLKL